MFASSGAGTTSSGVLDSNNAGTVTADTTLGVCTYAVGTGTGRIDLKLNLSSGTCAGGASSKTTQEFAAYQTAQGSAVMLELDATALATGAAYQQTAIPTIASTGSLFIPPFRSGFNCEFFLQNLSFFGEAGCIT